ncbi:cupin domain-containing protein [Motilimonas sp. 1_MG-2023]|uniref:cupin domain-containing protein n=1 Tax=Motilimonas sp. 1_MG-2023 TaxID=3062672 RepID=UPI0026E1DA76|nr:cupin domain-containing protein [Motilimonas sp. 1_MG-2023]MDO6527398.1 cupin domain-containing protein [Motilimonas sp. 1_MG-2023]
MVHINLDFTQKVVIDTAQQPWVDSPLAGVTRKILSREGAESGHATSIVRYAANSYFKPHHHPMGEEIFVLEGVFSDEHGDYPAGTYLRNPPGSSHQPFSKEGCVIFVKLNQFLADDLTSVRVNSNETPWLAGQGGLQVMPLHQHDVEHTALVKWPAGEQFVPHRHFGGEEILVLSGEFCDEYARYPSGTWLRSPHMSEHHPYVEQETVILVKIEHLGTATQ